MVLSPSRRRLSALWLTWIGIVLAGTATAHAQFDVVYATSKLAGNTENSLVDITPNSRFGAAVARIDDLDFNGVEDLAIGAPGDSSSAADGGALWLVGVDDTGAYTYAFRANVAPETITDDLNFGQSIGVFTGEEGNAPASTATTLTLVVGAPGASGVQDTQGAVYLVFINRADFSVTTKRITFGTEQFTQNPTAFEFFGSAVAVLDDQDGNGYADIAVGAPGIDAGGSDAGGFYILYLGAGGSVEGYKRIDANTGLGMPADDDDFNGASLAVIDDVNGDGFDDLAVGAPGDEDGGGLATGVVRLVYLGGDTGVMGGRKITSASTDFLAAGGVIPDGAYFGASVAAGDVNGDGLNELLVGASADGTGGAVYIMTLIGDEIVGTIKKLDGSTPGFNADLGVEEGFGSSVAVLQDLDGDSLREIAVGHELDDDYFNGGAAWIVYYGVCGNGTLDGDEECDDGAREEGDCCKANCSFDEINASCTDDSQICTNDICDEFGNCTHPGNASDCDDETSCNGSDSCDPDTGTCTLHSDDFCMGGAECQTFCNVSTHSCANPYGDPCADDGNPCTDDVCSGEGFCIHPDNTDPCNDGNPCTSNDMCNGSGDCVPGDSLPDGDPCDDGSNCTTGSTCLANVCGGGTPVDCSGLDSQCSEGLCNTESGDCLLNPINEGSSCDDDSLCTTGEICIYGECDGGTVTDCSGMNDQCNTGFCDPITGSCEADPVDNETPCDDGFVCTIGDNCSAGNCIGTPKDCSGSADQCNSGTCNDVSGICEPTPLGNGTGCNDADPCTINDVCTDGVCAGVAKNCSGSADNCNAGVCNAGTGACEASPLTNGTGCNDGSLCSTGDVCTDGVCGGTAVDCSGSADQCNTGVCSEESGTCSSSPVENSTGCNDGLLCTTGDICTGGVCAGTATDCSSFTDECNTGVCNAGTGTCEASPVANGTGCNDVSNCTTGDVCTAGTCAGTALDCSGSADQCNNGICNDETGTCQSSPVANDTGCNDGLLCTTGDLCTGGVCAGTATDCSGLTNQCNTGVCNTGTGACEATPVGNGTGCDDGSLCTAEDVCSAGVCAGIAVDCSGLADQCNGGVCNAGTGACQAAPLGNGTGCDDGLACTTNDVCTNGVCGGTAVDCSGSSDQCNTGTCNMGTGACEAVPVDNGTGCSDGLLCTTGDVCTAGTCAGTAVDCSASGNQCNTGVCNAGTGACEAAPVGNGTGCNDSLNCTTGDVCTGGTCAGTAVDCSGLTNQCNTGTCNTESGTCEAVPVGGGVSCSDGLLCTIGDTCLAGVCTGSAMDCSGSSDQCNTGVCNTGTGQCESTPVANGGGCGDGDPCTTNDVCTDGLCGGTPVDCSGTDDDCNTGVCNSETGNCQGSPLPDLTACNDGDVCTTNDICIGGLCGGGAVDCSASSDDCNAGVCDPVSGSCVAQPSNEEGPCDDGLFCTEFDHCQAGSCTGDNPCGTTPICSETCNEREDECKTCGHPYSNDRCVVNAVYILQAAVGLQDCEPCFCDVNSTFDVTSSDAAAVLRSCVHLPIVLDCPTGNVLTGPDDGVPAVAQ